MFSRFLFDRHGNFALTTAVMMVPLLGAAGLAVDYTRAVTLRHELQNLADEAALNAVHVGASGDTSKHLAFAEGAARQGSISISGITATDKWLAPNTYQVSLFAEMPITLFSAVPGVPKTVDVSVSTIVESGQPKYVYKEPKVSKLDPEASDYNRLSVYCFDPNQASEPSRGRSQMTDISDNAGTHFDYKMPQCGAGEYLSYKLLNARGARAAYEAAGSERARRDTVDDAQTYSYFTDTVFAEGRENYTGLDTTILETVMCDTLGECKPHDQNGILPTGKNRTPQRAEDICEPGKYMYYGWEDRPPENGWTDRDFDDIRVVIECPKVETVGSEYVRLIK